MQKEMLSSFALDLKDMIPSTGLTLAKATQSLRAMRGFIDTADVYGPARQGRIVSFLKLYPNMFAIQGSGPKIIVFVAAAPEPRPVVARPVQVGGASSSGGPEQRAERAVEVDARAPYRKFPNEQRVVYGANPARVNTPRHRRYANYSDASTIGGARRLGATSQDISLDIQAGALRLL